VGPRADETELSDSIFYPVDFGGASATFFVFFFKFDELGKPLHYFGLRYKRRVQGLGQKRHPFDEPHHQWGFLSETSEIIDLVIVLPWNDDNIDFYGRETVFYRGFKAQKGILDLAQPGDSIESVRPKGVEADVDPSKPCLLERSSQRGKENSVCGQGNIIKTVYGGQLANELNDSLSDQRLSTCHPDTMDAF